MNFKERVMREKVDELLSDLRDQWKGSLTSLRTQRQQIQGFINTNSAIYQTAFTVEEQSELQQINTALANIETHIETNLPEVPESP